MIILPANKKTTDMFIIIGLMLTGMLLGYLLRRKICAESTMSLPY